LLPDPFPYVNIHQNAFTTGPPPQTSLGKLTPRPLSWTWRPLLGTGREGKERIRKWRGGKKREGVEGKEREIGPKRVGWVCPSGMPLH